MRLTNFIVVLGSLATSVGYADITPVGRLVFEDRFERNESQADRDEVGNGWKTNNDKPWSRGLKQTELDDGVLKTFQADPKKANLLVIRPIEMGSGAFSFRFRMESDADFVGLVIADTELKEVHAGHVMSVRIFPDRVIVADMLTGTFEPTLYAKKQADKLTQADRELIGSKKKTIRHTITPQAWHDAVVNIVGDEVTVGIDGREVTRFRSSGFAHPAKSILRLAFGGVAAIDDFRIYELPEDPAVSRSVSGRLNASDDASSPSNREDVDQMYVYRDTFESPDNPGRTTVDERGRWTFAAGVASAESDPDLFKKFRRHGPAIRWPLPYHDGRIDFEFRPDDCQRVTITLDGDGHVFRITLTDPREETSYGPPAAKQRLIAWSTRSSKENKGDAIFLPELPTLADLNHEWTRLTLEIQGSHGVLSVGDFRHEFTHAALARHKTATSVTFGYGRLSLRNVSLTLDESFEPTR